MRRGRPPWRQVRCGLYRAWRDPEDRNGGGRREHGPAGAMTMANHSVPAGDATGGQGLLLTAALPSAQRRQGCERVLGLVFDRRRIENRVRLARIKVDSENQEFGRNGAEIDRV